MNLFLLDAIAPFFRGIEHQRINWSKIPFAHFHEDGRLNEAKLATVTDDFEIFCARAAATGFNAITLDDIAHLSDSPDYASALRDLTAGYRRCFKNLFAIAARHGLRIYITSDLMFFPAAADESLREKMRMPEFLSGLVRGLLSEFPEIAGIIVRLGESDGRDVRGAFLSALVIRTPAECRRWIGALLEVCEAEQRDLVVRTWSVGAYHIGDLIWNRDTYFRVFESFRSDRLIVSIKYGETDFFRFLPLNPQFFRGHHRKLIELQARREYEGCGEFPSFIGPDYAAFRDQLRAGDANMAGIMVWCQTGGWTRFGRLTYLPGSSVWNEINTWVALRLFRDNTDVAGAVADWCDANGFAAHAYDIQRLLQLSHEVIRELLYMDDLSGTKLFFRRLRLPPLWWVYWDQIMIGSAISRVMDCFVRDGRRQLRIADAAMEKLARMHELAARCGLPAADIEFQRDTFEILAAARAYFFLPPHPAREQHLRELVATYTAKHPDRHYEVRLDFGPAKLKRRTISRAIKILLRDQRGYRIVDRIITLRLLSWLYPLLRRRTKLLPDFAHDRAMGIETIFK